ncbi:unnamed protein product [Urochloa decumbens]|uniref:Late embryogenesis abundant protein LEA-2 subgroup domain-containing protein n=1 Tax=Urochloa decumbens TaxID=240449 RepID=A0ABC8ZBD8_9POAL
MDRREPLLSRLDRVARIDGSHLPNSARYCVLLLIFILSLVMATFCGYIFFVDPNLLFGNIKFSMEPVAYAGLGLDGDTAPPAFNVTLRATSTFNRRFCSTGGGTVQAAFSGLTVAAGHVARFCVEAKGSAVIASTVSSAWTALPAAFRDRINHGRQNGGVELEIDLGFENEIKGPMWVRCRAILDAKQRTRCRVFTLSSF